MRILQISSARTYGEGERHVVDLSREMVKRGHEVFVALRPTNEWQQRLAFLPDENFLHTSIRNSFGMFSSRSIARFIKKNRIDIVHAHLARDYLAADVATRSDDGVKFVLTRHKAAPLKPFYRFALRNVDAAIAVDPTVREQLEKVFPAKNVELIANGIGVDPVETFRASGADLRALHGIPQEAPLIVVTDELKLSMGQRDVVLAANEVVKRFPDCHFVIAGDDRSIDKRFRRELKRLVRVFGMDRQFIWLNAVADTSHLVAAADIFVSASHSDTSRLAVLEAMSAGKAVIATETETSRDLITDPRALTPVRDPIALAERISACLENKEVRLEIGDGLKAAVSEKFGLEQMADATEKLYRKVIGR